MLLPKTNSNCTEGLTGTANRNHTERFWLMLLFAFLQRFLQGLITSWHKLFSRRVYIGLKYFVVWPMSLFTRGLALRGHDIIIGWIHYGNFLDITKLLSKCDPFLATHIKNMEIKGMEAHRIFQIVSVMN